MSAKHLKRQKGRCLLLVTVLALSTFPLNAQGEVFKPDDRYSLSDYQAYGMIFYAHHREVVEKLVDKLLEIERALGYSAGATQEKQLRGKAKKYYALFRGVYPASAIKSDDDENAAQKASSKHLAEWYGQMPKCTNQDGAKLQAEKEYRDALGQ